MIQYGVMVGWNISSTCGRLYILFKQNVFSYAENVAI